MPTLVLPDALIDYDLAGQGAATPLVLVHGGMCDRADWDRLAPHLPANHPVLRLELRAHGRSTGAPESFTIAAAAADLVALLRHLALAPAILVGHSLGARVVAEAAAQAPQCAARLVFIDGSRAEGGRAAPTPPQTVPPMAASLATIIDATIGPHADADARARIHATMAAASPELMAACIAALGEWDRTRADTVYPGLACPVLALQSTYHDRHTPRRTFECREETSNFLDFLREAVPDLAVAVFPRCGHFIMVEHPAEVARHIAKFAAGLPVGEQ